MACDNVFGPSTDNRHLYIFIDESGDFNFSHHGSPFYIFTALWTYQPTCVAQELIQLRYALLAEGRDVPEFHAHLNPKPVRERVYEKLMLHSCLKGASIVLRKNRLNPILRQPWTFYPRFLDSLLKFVLKGDIRNKYDRVFIFTDRPPTKKVGLAVRRGLTITVPRYIRKGVRYNLYQHPAASHSGLQAADYCSWAISRFWTMGKKKYRKMVMPWYDKEELDVFGRGRDEYY